MEVAVKFRITTLQRRLHRKLTLNVILKPYVHQDRVQISVTQNVSCYKYAPVF